MTMLARAAIDHALNEVGSRSPAAVLARTDAAMRAMIEENQMFRGHCHQHRCRAGLRRSPGRSVVVCRREDAPYWSDGDQVAKSKATAGARSTGAMAIIITGISRWCRADYYLATDGILTSPAVITVSASRRRFTAMLRDHAALPLAAQCTGFAETLARYQGGAAATRRYYLVVFSF